MTSTFRCEEEFLQSCCSGSGSAVSLPSDSTHNSERDHLQTSYTNLTKERDQLQTSNNNLTKERDSLHTGVKKSSCRAAAVVLGLLCLLLLTGLITLVCLFSKGNSERDQLQTSYTNLTKERDQLQTSYTNLTKERDQLQTRVEYILNYFQKIIQELGWVYFYHSFYYTSSNRTSWQQSRADCLQRGGDLIVINSKEEQDFAIQFQRCTWIGLTDGEAEGIWKWVDGTALNTSYWLNGEPNDLEREDCAEIALFDKETSWNDQSCIVDNFWICEKMMAP
ncbi:CD209 antigen-like protein E [Pseudoliparis swirei]|uniref:CD209 antigen-like protein E n=1 Tax=Pseudoliparis swirei TaxID=2059687 RepID=UPI0024BE2BA6|nr:CD209 antigen-like protein E [Pseudoliparis swirei]